MFWTLSRFPRHERRGSLCVHHHDFGWIGGVVYFGKRLAFLANHLKLPCSRSARRTKTADGRNYPSYGSNSICISSASKARPKTRAKSEHGSPCHLCAGGHPQETATSRSLAACAITDFAGNPVSGESGQEQQSLRCKKAATLAQK